MNSVKNPIHNKKISMKTIKLFDKEYNIVYIGEKTYIIIEGKNTTYFEYLVDIDTLEKFKKNHNESLFISEGYKIENNININNNNINKNRIEKMIILEKGKELNIGGDKYMINEIKIIFNDNKLNISLSISGLKNFLTNKSILIDLETLSKFININNNKNIKNNINLNFNKIYSCTFNSFDLYIIEGNLYIINNDDSLIDLSSILSITNINMKDIKEIIDNNSLKKLKYNSRIYKGSYVINKKFINIDKSNTDELNNISYNSLSNEIKKKMKSNKKKVKDIEIDFDRKKIYLIFENSSTKNNAADYIPYPYYTKNGYNIFNEVIIKNNNKKEKKVISKINQSGNVIIYSIDGENYNKDSIEKFDPKKHIVKNKYKREGYLYGKSFKVGDFVYLTTDKLKKKYIVKSVPIIGSTIGIKLFNSTSNTLQSADKEILHHYDILKVGDKVRVNSDDSNSKPKEITAEKKTGILGMGRKIVYELNGEKGHWYSEDSLIIVNSKKINKNIKYENKPIKRVQYKGALKEVEEVIKPRYNPLGNISFKLKGIDKPVPKSNINKIIYNNGPTKGIISAKKSASSRRT